MKTRSMTRKEAAAALVLHNIISTLPALVINNDNNDDLSKIKRASIMPFLHNICVLITSPFSEWDLAARPCVYPPRVLRALQGVRFVAVPQPLQTERGASRWLCRQASWVQIFLQLMEQEARGSPESGEEALLLLVAKNPDHSPRLLRLSISQVPKNRTVNQEVCRVQATHRDWECHRQCCAKHGFFWPTKRLRLECSRAMV